MVCRLALGPEVFKTDRSPSPHPVIGLYISSRAKFPCHFGVNIEQSLKLQCGWIPLPSSQAFFVPFSLFKFSHWQEAWQLFANREEKLLGVPKRGFMKLGCSWVRPRPTWNLSAVVTIDRQVVAFFLPDFYPFLTVLFHPLFPKVCFRHRGGGCDGSQPSKDEGWGSNRQF